MLLWLSLSFAAFADDPPPPPPPPSEEDDDDDDPPVIVPFGANPPPPAGPQTPAPTPPTPAPTAAPPPPTKPPPAKPPAATAPTTPSRYASTAAPTAAQAGQRLLAIRVEGGYSWLAGTAASSWSPGVAVRVEADLYDGGQYRAYGAYGLSLHHVVDPTPIVGETPGIDVTASSQLHQLVGGGRYELIPEKRPAGFRAVPYVGGGGGLVLLVNRTTADDLVTQQIGVRLDLEGTAGVELRFGDATIGIGARLALMPTLYSYEGKTYTGGTIPLTPAIAAGWRF